MDQPVLADVEVARARAASPIVHTAIGQVVLKPVETRPAPLAETLQLFVNPRLSLAQWFELSCAVVNDAERAAEPEFDSATSHRQRVFGVFDPAADHRIDTDVKFGVLGQVA